MPFQGIGFGIEAQIRTAYRISELKHYFRKWSSTGTAGSGKVNMLQISENLPGNSHLTY
jgi:hypothetical protein